MNTLPHKNSWPAWILCVLLLYLISGCRTGGSRSEIAAAPDDLIAADSMVKILVDVHLIESSLKTIHTKKQDNEHFTDRYYTTLFEKHHITRQQFLRSMDYYERNAGQLEKIYENVIIELSKLESEVR
ncbi:MAG: DUF4296 domain-containing protein [Bacteroidales bacterium]|nr:DUF4296 domain-containing protein [Lentimicrobiaceae bacterium]MDD5693706.1 DUF4296 domain-containing protein [Bacteroidales bacterium]